MAGWIMETYAKDYPNELANNDSMRDYAVPLLAYNLKCDAVENLIRIGERDVLDAVLATRERRYDPLQQIFWEWNLDAETQHNIAMRKYPAVLGEHLLQDSIGMSVKGLTEETIRTAAERCGRTLSKTWWKKNYRPASVPEVISRKRPARVIKVQMSSNEKAAREDNVLKRTIESYASARQYSYISHVALMKILTREFGNGASSRSRDMWAAFFALTEYRGEAAARDLIATVRTLGRIGASAQEDQGRTVVSDSESKRVKARRKAGRS
jgi:hypothetical protein